AALDRPGCQPDVLCVGPNLLHPADARIDLVQLSPRLEACTARHGERPQPTRLVDAGHCGKPRSADLLQGARNLRTRTARAARAGKDRYLAAVTCVPA